MRIIPILLVWCIVATAIALSGESVAGALQFQKIALSGDFVPGAGSGKQFEDFSAPVINSGGDVFVGTTLGGPDIGDLYASTVIRWSIEGGVASSLAYGNAVPDFAEGTTFGSSFGRAINSHSLSSSSTALMGPGITSDIDSAIFTEDIDGSLTLIAQEGNQLPDLPNGVELGSLHGRVPGISDTGHMVFEGYLRGPGINFLNDEAIYSYDPAGGLKVVARQDGSAVGAGSNASYASFGRLFLGDNGTFGFIAELSGSEIDFTNNLALYRDMGHGLQVVARSGDTAPGFVGDVMLGGQMAPSKPDANGHIAFATLLQGEDISTTEQRVLYRESSHGEFEVIAQSGTQAPDVDAGIEIFAFSGAPKAIGEGHTLFLAELAGASVDSTNDRALYRRLLGGSTELIAVEGGPAPVSADATFTNLQAGYAANDRGQASFIGHFRYGSDMFGSGLFATDVQGALRLIAKVGDTIDVSDVKNQPDMRTIDSFYFEVGIEDWSGSSLGDNGEIAFTVIFTDGTWGVFVSNEVATGESLPGDFNNDGTVDLADYTVWRNNLGATGTGLAADGNGDSVVDAADYLVWKEHFGQSASGSAGAITTVPEPGAVLLLCTLALAVLGLARLQGNRLPGVGSGPAGRAMP